MIVKALFGADEDCRLRRTGHGVGLRNHEAPWVAEGSADVLAENMVISVEPGVYLKGQAGFRHSDTVLVTRDGHECLTRYPSDIESLTIRRWRLMTWLKGRMIRRALGLKEKAALGSTSEMISWESSRLADLRKAERPPARPAEPASR